MRETAAPERIGPYVIEATLGRGAMGVVYLARDSRIGRRVALKQIQIRDSHFETGAAASEYFHRLQREAEVCGSLHHPNIVTLFDVGYENERISYLAMEYVPGESLSEAIRRNGSRPLPIDFVARVGCDVLKGLAYAHSKGIVHRDIKPPNILIGHDGSATIADFGIARPEQSNLTIAGTLMGTPNYMSPEQAKGLATTPRSDLFSFGVMMFEMLTGSKPFAGGDVHSILQRIISVPTPSINELNPDLPLDYERFVQRLMAKNVVAIRSMTVTTPAVTIPKEQLEEFARKREELRNAESLYATGKYAESLKMYEAYLARYPYSTVAREGRDRALNSASTPKTRRRSKRDENISPAELLRRLKRAVRGK